MDDVAVVSPHLDDAVLSAWMVLQSQPHVRVITCFAGFPASSDVGSWDVSTRGARGRAAVETRRAEDRSALALTESEAVHLDFRDAQYRCADTDSNEIVDELARRLRPELANASEVWFPAGVGGHIDHVTARQASLSATVTGQRRYAYADLPYAGQPAWPADVTGDARDIAVDAAASILRAPTPVSMWRFALASISNASPEAAHLRKLTPAQVRNKWRAVSQYRSQLSALRCGRRNVLRRRRIFAYEAYWLLVLDPPESETMKRP